MDTLTIYFYIILKFYSNQKQSVSLSLRQGHFRRGDISFYIQNSRRFETQLIKTTKSIPTVINETADISISHRCRKERILRGLVTQLGIVLLRPCQMPVNSVGHRSFHFLESSPANLTTAPSILLDTISLNLASASSCSLFHHNFPHHSSIKSLR